jgi:hypothetical protein
VLGIALQKSDGVLQFSICLEGRQLDCIQSFKPSHMAINIRGAVSTAFYPANRDRSGNVILDENHRRGKERGVGALWHCWR